MLSVILEVFGELILQALLEVLLELGWHSVVEPLRKPPNPWLAALGYAIFGALLGGLSLLVFPMHLTPASWRVANLIVTPVAVGGLMVLLGRWRARRGEPVFRIDRFSYGYLLAFAFAWVRYVAAA
jgi:hypothetical protein